jgi:hypothetical protein
MAESFGSKQTTHRRPATAVQNNVFPFLFSFFIPLIWQETAGQTVRCGAAAPCKEIQYAEYFPLDGISEFFHDVPLISDTRL